MGGGKDAVVAILAILLGAGLGYFWHITRPADGLLMIIGVSIVCIGLVFISLRAMGSH